MRKIFTSNDFGAPSTSSQTAGSNLPILTACLVDGYGDQTPTSITRTGTTATMTLPNAHGFVRTGVFTISGCDQADYNGEFRVTVVDANIVTFTVANSPVTPATGAIVCRQDGAGWTSPFTDVNKAVYKQGAASNGLYLDVDDTVTQGSKVRGYELMSGVGAGTSPFPTVVQSPNRYFLKSNGSGDWFIIADEDFFYYWTTVNATTHGTAALHFFGDIEPRGPVQPYGTLLVAAGAATYAVDTLTVPNASSGVQSGCAMARDYTGIGGSKIVSIVGHSALAKGSSYLGAGGSDYPDPITGELLLDKLKMLSYGGSDNILGYVPGAYNPLHYLPFGNTAHSYFAGSGDLLGDEFIYTPAYSNASCIIKIDD